MYTTAEIIDRFRAYSGENAAGLTPATILIYVNMAYRGGSSVLRRLYPLRKAAMGTAAKSKDYNTVADTETVAVAELATLLKIDRIGIKYDADGDYVWTQIEAIAAEPIQENDDRALSADSSEPVLGLDGGSLYIWPKPGNAVTAGVRMQYLDDPAAIVTGGAGGVINDELMDIAIVEATKLYYLLAKKQTELAEAQAAVVNDMVAQAVRNSPGRRSTSIMPGPGNLFT